MQRRFSSPQSQTPLHAPHPVAIARVSSASIVRPRKCPPLAQPPPPPSCAHLLTHTIPTHSIHPDAPRALHILRESSAIFSVCYISANTRTHIQADPAVQTPHFTHDHVGPRTATPPRTLPPPFLAGPSSPLSHRRQSRAPPPCRRPSCASSRPRGPRSPRRPSRASCKEPEPVTLPRIKETGHQIRTWQGDAEIRQRRWTRGPCLGGGPQRSVTCSTQQSLRASG